MAKNDLKTWLISQGGLDLEVTALDNDDGTTSFVVKCVTGSGDINGVYWGGNGVADNSQFNLGGSLNMNGAGQPDYDGGIKLSDSGLGHAALNVGTASDGAVGTGVSKATFLTAGQSYSFTTSVDWDSLDVLGIRATSVNGGGSIKGFDTKADITYAPPPPVEHCVDGNVVFQFNFNNEAVDQNDTLGQPAGFWNLADWVANHPADYGQDPGTGFSTSMQVHSGMLDTAASPGNIFLQAIPGTEFDHPNAQVGGIPDLEEGKSYHLKVSILKQDYPDMPATPGTVDGAEVTLTLGDESFSIAKADITVGANTLQEFVFEVTGDAGDDYFSIQSHGTNNAWQGLLIDCITVTGCVMPAETAPVYHPDLLH
jgi:hypothetical protein